MLSSFIFSAYDAGRAQGDVVFVGLSIAR
jgi:hypothetical protein